MPPRFAHFRFCLILLGSLLPAVAPAKDKLLDPPQSSIGERLFLETRFSQFFHLRSLGDANAVLRAGDVTVANTAIGVAAMPGAFAGRSMNCRACHLVDEHAASAGNRSYCDFTRRSPIPERGDGLSVTPRNSPPLLGVVSRGADAPALHFDGEFSTAEDLVVGGMLGRNFGWLPDERAKAVAHIAHIIRDDDGAGLLARQFGGAYAKVFAGVDTTIPARLRLAPEWRLDVAKATDEQIVRHIARLVTAYMAGLDFSRDAAGHHNGSPYDRFLLVNGLPRAPESGETPREYGKRLLLKVLALESPRFVSANEGRFRTHRQDFSFGPRELEGLKIFFATPAGNADPKRKGGVGNCIACHAAPEFTDFRYHNTGASQEEYDDIHGAGAFAALPVPDLAARAAAPAAYLPRTAAHPEAAAVFISPPSAEFPGRTDLGLWNVLTNPDFPSAQARLRAAFADPGKSESDDELLLRSLAAFRTPGLRNLGHSDPYMHTGGKDSLGAVIRFYRDIAVKSRAGAVRNADPELAGITLSTADEPPLSAFLRALNEDYE